MDFCAMINHNFECPEGHITEKLVDVNEKDWTKQICDQDECPCLAERVFLSKRMQALHRLPITIYRNSNGEVRFPGSAREPMPANYKEQGFERVEMTYHEARKFEKEFSAQERARSSDKLEFQHFLETEKNKGGREDLLHEMRGMSNYGRDFAQYVIEQNNREDAGRFYSEDPGFYIEVLN